MYGPGTVLAGRYRLDERVGSGGMGEVWRATDEVLERTVAVKLMRQELVEEPGFAARFLTEARTMAAVSHPGVVALHDYRGDDAAAFLVMEYVEGEALSRRLHRFGKLDPVRTMHMVAQAAEALHAAHQRGVVHRDIKPANLLVTASGSVVLTDFGIARSAASTSLTATGAVVGTPSYLAPEQVLGKPATALTDVYALGVVAYECLAGRRPFDGDTPFEVAIKRLREPPPTLAVNAPPAVLMVVEKALAIEPEQRWQSAAELAAAARRAANPESPAGPTTPTSGPPGGPVFTPARVRIPPSETSTGKPPPAPTRLEPHPAGQPLASPPPSSGLPPLAAPASPAYGGAASPPAYSRTPPPSPAPPSPPPPPWRPPGRPVTVTLACLLLAFSSAVLALYFGGSLAAVGTYITAYERYFFREGRTDLNDAAAAVGVVGGLIAGAGLATAVVLLLLAWPTYLGKRAARGWVFALGGTILLCCSAPVTVDSFGTGLGSFGPGQAARAELQRTVIDSMPGWYGLIVGPLPVIALGALLVALFLLTVPAASRYYSRLRPHQFGYPQYPRYYGYPPRR